MISPNMLALFATLSMQAWHGLLSTTYMEVRAMVQHRKQCKRYNDAGHAHFLTFSCDQRKPYLSKDRTRTWMLEAIERSRVEHQFHLWAYDIMPEHVHLLLWPSTPEYSISMILKSLKQSVSRKAIIHLRQQQEAVKSFRFWQRGGGYDQNLSSIEAIWNIVDYIHANPVRRNLCERPTDWKWCSAQEMISPQTGLLRLNLESMPRAID